MAEEDWKKSLSMPPEVLELDATWDDDPLSDSPPTHEGLEAGDRATAVPSSPMSELAQRLDARAREMATPAGGLSALRSSWPAAAHVLDRLTPSLDRALDALDSLGTTRPPPPKVAAEIAAARAAGEGHGHPPAIPHEVPNLDDVEWELPPLEAPSIAPRARRHAATPHDPARDAATEGFSARGSDAGRTTADFEELKLDLEGFAPAPESFSLPPSSPPDEDWAAEENTTPTEPPDGSLPPGSWGTGDRPALHGWATEDDASAETEPPLASGTPNDELKERYSAGDFTGALVLAEQALEHDPDDADALRYAESCRQALAQLYATRLGSLEQIATLAIPAEQIRWLALDHRAGFLLSLVDGQSSLEEILDISGMPRLDALRILYQLLAQRVISLAG